ncbi:head completion/stabilization protein [Pseudoduganella sp. FT55W]|uniref:Head completion/stabilization protein n=1 Tax=Duganella rivi TaxID=2666083 RepID=A0A7X4KEL3_9BURK|nr:head completion/stabilization protein [Duganella rivi]MYM70524.1 head completion/stabilization protein [Duganella rivi]
MSSFIANEPVSTPTSAPGETPPAGIITNDGFFPDIDLAHLRAAVRLNGTVTDERLVDALVSAMINVNGELAAWKVASIAAGAVNLEAMPPQLGGKSIKATLYRTAVYRSTKADLTERYRDYDSTKAGDRAADELEPSIDDDRRAARWAIRDLLGVARTTVELI